MPRLDRSGPEGAGARSGRAQGLCNPNTRADAAAAGRGGGGRGRGRGFGSTGAQGMGRQAAVVNEETSGLAAQVEQLQETLAQVQDRLDMVPKKD